MIRNWPFLLLAFAGIVPLALAQEKPVLDDSVALAATKQGLQRLYQAGRNWQENATCFSCHHQPLPMFAAVEAAKFGIPVEAKELKFQSDFTHGYFQPRIETMNVGKHIPGGSATAGFGLWAMMLNRRPPDDTTTAIVAYLLQVQGIAGEKAKIEGPWAPSCTRVPMNSKVGATVLALIGMKHYATESQRKDVEKATTLAEAWLAKAPLGSTDDRFWRLWGLHLFAGNAATIEEIRTALIAAQQKDSGWSQTPKMTSDAYATGQVLYVLRQTGTRRDDAIAMRAAAYLIRTQYADGSWRVETRAKAVQPYFDNGDPYEKHQFLSVAATSWATAALAQMLPAAKQ